MFLSLFDRVRLFVQKNKVLTGVSATVLFIALFYLVLPDLSLRFFTWIKLDFVFKSFWIYIFVAFVCTFFCLYLVLSPYRNKKLGKKGDKPEYNLVTWFAMLFSAGMGTGVMFCGVYEPLYHYIHPPAKALSSLSPFDFSFLLTFWHWGLAGWALYVVVGFSLTYLCSRKNLPLRFSSALEPIFKQKIKGSLGYVIDALTVLCTLFGVATTLGRGAMQLNAGLSEVYGISFSTFNQSWLIVGITFLVTLSILSGLNRGVRRLSELNIILCFCLLLFLFFSGPTGFLIKSFFKSTGIYFLQIFNLKTWFTPFGGPQWQSEWTTLYWAWWMAWAPFVGLFIARISKGRTVKEFILGSLLAPSLISFFWFVIYGGTAIHEHIQNNMDLTSFLEKDYAVIIFKFLPHFSFYPWVSYLSLFAILVFFITSSDSASYMISNITQSPSVNSPYRVYKKIYWASLEGFLALFFLLLGGIRVLEQMVIVISSPFCILIVLLIVSLIKQLREDSLA